MGWRQVLLVYHWRRMPNVLTEQMLITQREKSILQIALFTYMNYLFRENHSMFIIFILLQAARHGTQKN